MVRNLLGEIKADGTWLGKNPRLAGYCWTQTTHISGREHYLAVLSGHAPAMWAMSVSSLLLSSGVQNVVRKNMHLPPERQVGTRKETAKATLMFIPGDEMPWTYSQLEVNMCLALAVTYGSKLSQIYASLLNEVYSSRVKSLVYVWK